jgi:hypothetical protein
VKYCSILKKQQTPPTSYVGTSDKKKNKSEITNVFMLLESESESEGEEETDTPEVLTDKKPALDYTSIIRITMEKQKEQSQTQQEQSQVQVKPKAVVPAVRVIGKSRWLDVVSSSDEDDSEEE